MLFFKVFLNSIKCLIFFKIMSKLQFIRMLSCVSLVAPAKDIAMISSPDLKRCSHILSLRRMALVVRPTVVLSLSLMYLIISVRLGCRSGSPHPCKYISSRS